MPGTGSGQEVDDADGVMSDMPSRASPFGVNGECSGLLREQVLVQHMGAGYTCKRSCQVVTSGDLAGQAPSARDPTHMFVNHTLEAL